MTKENNTLFVTAEGKLNDDDYDLLVPEVEEMIEKHGLVNWYFRMKEFDGWTPSAFLRDLKVDIENEKYFHRVAIVGENKWQEAMAKVMKPFTSATIKYFDEENNEKALGWIAN